MPALRELLARYEVEFDDAKLRRGNRHLDRTDRKISRLDRAARGLRRTFSGLGGAMAGAAAALGGVQTFRTAFSFINDLVEQSRSLSTLAGSLNATSDALVRLRTFAGMGGRTWDWSRTTRGLIALQRAAGQAIEEPRSTQARAFRRAGIDRDFLQEASQIENGVILLFEELFEGLSTNIGTQSQRGFTLQQLGLETVAEDWLELTNLTRDQRRVEFERAAALSQQQASFQKEAESNEEAWRNARASIDELKAAIARGLLPLVIELTPHLAKLTKFIAENPLVVKAALIGAAVVTVLGAIGLLGFALAGLATPLGQFVLFIGAVVTAVGLAADLLGEVFVTLDNLGIITTLTNFAESLLRAVGASDETILQMRLLVIRLRETIRSLPLIGNLVAGEPTPTEGEAQEREQAGRMSLLRDQGFKNWINSRWSGVDVQNVPVEVLSSLRQNWQRQMVQQKRETNRPVAVQNNQTINLTVEAAGETDPQRLARAVKRVLDSEVRSVHRSYSTGVA